MNDKLYDILSRLWAGLQVPVSLSMPLGAAQGPWNELKELLHLQGWKTSEEVLQAIKKYTVDSHPYFGAKKDQIQDTFDLAYSQTSTPEPICQHEWVIGAEDGMYCVICGVSIPNEGESEAPNA
jgi:hypothetical protein